jgi:sporulation-control protein
MSFMKRALASIGIGSAQVDTVLASERIRPGDTLTGTVYVRGGGNPQKIEHIYLSLMTRYLKSSGDHEHYVDHVLSEARVQEGFEIAAGETRELSFSLSVPWETPLSVGKSTVWVKTGLSVSMALDPSDRDALRVEPTAGMQTVLEALERLSFYLYKADTEGNRRSRRRVPFVQELEFRPGGRYAGRMKELEIILEPSPDGLEVLLEVDLRARGLMGALMEEFDLNERFTHVRFSNAELEQPDTVSSKLVQALEARL